VRCSQPARLRHWNHKTFPRTTTRRLRSQPPVPDKRRASPGRSGGVCPPSAPRPRAGAFLFGSQAGFDALCFPPAGLVGGLSNVLDPIRHHQYSYSSGSCGERFICARNIAQPARRDIGIAHRNRMPRYGHAASPVTACALRGACLDERVADPLHCRRVDAELGRGGSLQACHRDEKLAGTKWAPLCLTALPPTSPARTAKRAIGSFERGPATTRYGGGCIVRYATSHWLRPRATILF